MKRLFVALACAGAVSFCSTAHAYEARMYGMTGLLGQLFGLSGGIPTVLDKASKAQPTVKVYLRKHWQKNAVYETAKANYKIDNLPIILVGHSLGADAVSWVAERLRQDGIPVAAAFYYDPTPNVACVPKNIQAAIGWHNTMLLQLGGSPISACAGFKGDIENHPIFEAHTALDDDPVIHAQTLKHVGEVITMIREIKGTK